MNKHHKYELFVRLLFVFSATHLVNFVLERRCTDGVILGGKRLTKHRGGFSRDSSTLSRSDSMQKKHFFVCSQTQTDYLWGRYYFISLVPSSGSDMFLSININRPL